MPLSGAKARRGLVPAPRLHSRPISIRSIRPQIRETPQALVDFYCRVSLNECFDEVQTCLKFPYQRCPEDSVLFYARAQHDFEGDANPRMLPLTRGDLVHVISTRAKEQGWWKGWLNGRIGFFPLSFVTRQP
ncbi:Protein vav-1 [Taenia solium]|eukprot:TsM_000661500 transcript=TsM_000661500 gene=TsM_000661500